MSRSVVSPPNVISVSPMNADVASAFAFVEYKGIVLVSAKGPVPRLVDAVAGEPISGNWWSHPRASHIYNVLTEVCESERILVCRLISGKRTLVHDRLWPALVRIAYQCPCNLLARVYEDHTKTGRHKVRELPFPEWVPRTVAEEATLIGEMEAITLLSPWLRFIAPTLEAGRRPEVRF